MKKVIIFISILAAVLLMGLGIFIYFGHQDNSLATISQSQTRQSAQAAVGDPVRLTIPKINVDATVEHLGLAADGTVAAPAGPYDVAWYSLGPRPGETGSAVISGHFGPWKSGAHSVFDRLSELKPGDIVSVTDNQGKTTSFVVRRTQIYNPGDSAPEVFNKNDGTYLNLITCNGDWIPNQKTYTKRLVVFTEKVQ